MNITRILTSSAVAALLAISMNPAAHANLVVNGSFEDSSFGAPGGYTLGLLGSAVPGWTIPSGDGTYPWGLTNGAYGAFTPYGNQFIVLGEYGPAVEYTIQQTLTGLTAGSTYNLSFAIASELNCCAQTEVSYLSGSSTLSQTFSATPSGSFWTDWTTHSMSFVADSSSVTFQFKDVNPTTNGYDLGLDNVSVTSVPEPETYAMFMAGLGLMGFIARRRKNGQS
jgi:hypothetical protein